MRAEGHEPLIEKRTHSKLDALPDDVKREVARVVSEGAQQRFCW